MSKYTEEEILSMLKDEEKADEFLSTLTGEDVKRYLIYINSKVRNIPNEQNDIYSGNMFVGGLISPNNDIQNRYFEKIANALNNIKGNRNRATALHYLVNELHLFSDGNGRTGRCVFEIFTNPEFSFENNENFSHKTDSQNEGVGSSKFEEDNSLKFLEEAIDYPSYFVYRCLVENGLISQSPVKDCILSQTMVESLAINDYAPDTVFIEDDIKKTLSPKQIEDINLALCDNNNNESLSVAGLTMMLMQSIKWQKTNEEEFEGIPGYSYSQTYIDKIDDESKRTFEGWSKEDYLKAVRIANIIKESMLDAMLDIFEHPQNFTINSITIADILSKDIGEHNRKRLEIMIELSQNGNINLNGTRIQANMAKIREVIGQDIDSLTMGNVQDIRTLVDQIIPEISNPTLEDETERQTQSDIDKLVDKGTQEK